MKALIFVLTLLASTSSFAGESASDLQNYVNRMQEECKKAGVNAKITYDVKAVADQHPAGITVSKISSNFANTCQHLDKDHEKFNQRVSLVAFKHDPSQKPGYFDMKLNGKTLVFKADLIHYSDDNPHMSVGDSIHELLLK